jgi:hypothetical protein
MTSRMRSTSQTCTRVLQTGRSTVLPSGSTKRLTTRPRTVQMHHTGSSGTGIRQSIFGFVRSARTTSLKAPARTSAPRSGAGAPCGTGGPSTSSSVRPSYSAGSDSRAPPFSTAEAASSLPWCVKAYTATGARSAPPSSPSLTSRTSGLPAGPAVSMREAMRLSPVVWNPDSTCRGSGEKSRHGGTVAP